MDQGLYYRHRLMITGARSVADLDRKALACEAAILAAGLPDTDPNVQDLRRRIAGTRRWLAAGHPALGER